MTVVASRARERAPDTSRYSPILLRTTRSERQRLRIAVAEEDVNSYLDLFLKLLDDRDRRIKRRKAAQRHPLHIPSRDELDDEDD